MKLRVIAITFLISALLATATIGAKAQSPVPPTGAPQVAPGQGGPGGNFSGRRGGGMMKMMDQLGLTDAQKAKLKPIMDKQRSDMLALRQDTTLSPADKMTKMKSIHEIANKQVNAILTPDQQAKLKTLREQMRQRWGGPGGPGAGAPQTPPAN